MPGKDPHFPPHLLLGDLLWIYFKHWIFISLVCLSCFVFLSYCWGLRSAMHFFLLRFMFFSGFRFHCNVVSFGEELRGICICTNPGAWGVVGIWYACTGWDKGRGVLCCVAQRFGFLGITVSVPGTRTTYLVLFQLRCYPSLWEPKEMEHKYAYEAADVLGGCQFSRTN